jgi:transposase-like protein
MDTVEFSQWLEGICRLSGEQIAVAMTALTDFRDRPCPVPPSDSVESEGSSTAGGGVATSMQGGRRGRSSRIEQDAVGRIGERKVESQGCAHCGGQDIVRWGLSRGLPRYRCKSCSRTFNAATNTPLSGLRKKESWLAQTQAMIEGVSLAKAAERCGVHPSTAYRWRHRFLSAPALDKPQMLQGIVEADETFILESFKGRRSGLTRKPRHRGGKARHPGGYFENIPVLVARDRSGATIDAVLSEDTAACIAQALAGAVTPANLLVCDGGRPLCAFARRANIPVRVVPAPGKPLPGEPEIHINNVNAYHSRLKEWLRRFHGVATENLPNYLGWRRTLEVGTGSADPQTWLLAALGQGHYQYSTR